MEAYWMKSPEFSAKKLEQDMDDYWAKKGEKGDENDAAKDGDDADAVADAVAVADADADADADAAMDGDKEGEGEDKAE